MKERKIEIVVRKLSFEEEDEEDVDYWMSMSIQKRLEEAYKWNKDVWTHIIGHYPEKIEKTGGKMIKVETDEDDF